jgi:hypothetical protein
MEEPEDNPTTGRPPAGSPTNRGSSAYRACQLRPQTRAGGPGADAGCLVVPRWIEELMACDLAWAVCESAVGLDSAAVKTGRPRSCRRGQCPLSPSGGSVTRSALRGPSLRLVPYRTCRLRHARFAGPGTARLCLAGRLPASISIDGVGVRAGPAATPPAAVRRAATRSAPRPWLRVTGGAARWPRAAPAQTTGAARGYYADAEQPPGGCTREVREVRPGAPVRSNAGRLPCNGIGVARCRLAGASQTGGPRTRSRGIAPAGTCYAPPPALRSGEPVGPTHYPPAAARSRRRLELMNGP